MSERRSDAQKFYRKRAEYRQERQQAMKARDHHPRPAINVFHGVVITLCSSALFSLGQATAPTAPGPQGQSPVMTTTTTEQDPAATLPPEQLDSLVAPIALYSDPLLAT